MDSCDGPARGVYGVLEGGVPGDGRGAGAGDRLAVGHSLRGRRRREEVREYVPVRFIMHLFDQHGTVLG